MTTPEPTIEQLVERYMPALRSFVRLRMGPELRAREESCDVVQSVAREVLTHQQRFQHGGETGFRDWLFTTAHRKIVNHVEHWRAQKRDGARQASLPSELAQLGPTPSLFATAREQQRAIEAAFDTLSSEQRDVVIWSRLCGMSHTDIANRLAKSEVAVRKILSRALAALAARLAGYHTDLTSDRQ